ncbi:hypothetical protein [Streptacidiphilus fuscans]|uniref:Uncharacterized protein n=1 Tax=Streptacidiphilus fuscans TaxID=2789292 RepID=A0A931FGL6_9ACTN|nr:hypothetical protein [Streptacidiphilus fuscans]MBF9069694.1 hypothetical protein [Streptacidiphilus fuscans]
MAGSWRRLASVVGARARYQRRKARIAVVVLFVLLGIGFCFPAGDDSDPLDNVYFSTAVVLLLTAATLWVWRAPRTELPALRWRLRHRRVCWRGSVVALYGASFGLLANAWFAYRRDGLPASASMASYDHLDQLSRTCGSVGLWFLLLSPLPALLDVPTWRLMPRPLRRAAMVDRVTEELADPKRSLVRGDLPQRHVPAPGRPGRPLRLDPASKQYRLPFPAERLPALDWDGELLRVRARRGVVYGFSAEGPGPRPTTLAEVVEEVTFRHRRWMVLLDADGDRLLVVRIGSESTHLRANRLATLAGRANLAFAQYNLGWTKDDAGSVGPRLFPPVAHAWRVRRAARALAAPVARTEPADAAE